MIYTIGFILTFLYLWWYLLGCNLNIRNWGYGMIGVVIFVSLLWPVVLAVLAVWLIKEGVKKV